jgi:hypothetical protein
VGAVVTELRFSGYRCRHCSGPLGIDKGHWYHSDNGALLCWPSTGEIERAEPHPDSRLYRWLDPYQATVSERSMAAVIIVLTCAMLRGLPTRTTPAGVEMWVIQPNGTYLYWVARVEPNGSEVPMATAEVLG